MFRRFAATITLLFTACDADTEDSSPVSLVNELSLCATQADEDVEDCTRAVLADASDEQEAIIQLNELASGVSHSNSLFDEEPFNDGQAASCALIVKGVVYHFPNGTKVGVLQCSNGTWIYL
ncbi:hypothetical protein [Nannocystis pusilla]|uniref:hypothetical protein n=1 Tax=Nannocystis pusilla TaxID=889268 RepID=UPI003BF2608A